MSCNTDYHIPLALVHCIGWRLLFPSLMSCTHKVKPIEIVYAYKYCTGNWKNLNIKTSYKFPSSPALKQTIVDQIEVQE